MKCIHAQFSQKIPDENGQKCVSIFNKMFFIIKTYAIAAVWFKKATSLPKLKLFCQLFTQHVSFDVEQNSNSRYAK